MKMRRIENFVNNLRHDESIEDQIEAAREEGIITSCFLASLSAMNAKRGTELCLWCDEKWSVEHECEHAPCDYNCRFLFGEDYDGMALVRVTRYGLKTVEVNVVQEERVMCDEQQVFDEMSTPIVSPNLVQAADDRALPSPLVENVLDELPIAEFSSSGGAVQGAHQVFDETPEPNCNWKGRVSDAHQVFDVMSTPTVIPNEVAGGDDRAVPIVKEVVNEPLVAEISKDKDVAVGAIQVFDEMSKPTPTPGELETLVVVGIEPQRYEYGAVQTVSSYLVFEYPFGCNLLNKSLSNTHQLFGDIPLGVVTLTDVKTMDSMTSAIEIFSVASVEKSGRDAHLGDLVRAWQGNPDLGSLLENKNCETCCYFILVFDPGVLILHINSPEIRHYFRGLELKSVWETRVCRYNDPLGKAVLGILDWLYYFQKHVGRLSVGELIVSYIGESFGSLIHSEFEEGEQLYVATVGLSQIHVPLILLHTPSHVLFSAHSSVWAGDSRPLFSILEDQDVLRSEEMVKWEMVESRVKSLVRRVDKLNVALTVFDPGGYDNGSESTIPPSSFIHLCRVTMENSKPPPMLIMAEYNMRVVNVERILTKCMCSIKHCGACCVLLMTALPSSFIIDPGGESYFDIAQSGTYMAVREILDLRVKLVLRRVVVAKVLSTVGYAFDPGGCEYGFIELLNQLKWGHLKDFHAGIKQCELPAPVYPLLPWFVSSKNAAYSITKASIKELKSAGVCSKYCAIRLVFDPGTCDRNFLQRTSQFRCSSSLFGGSWCVLCSNQVTEASYSYYIIMIFDPGGFSILEDKDRLKGTVLIHTEKRALLSF